MMNVIVGFNQLYLLFSKLGVPRLGRKGFLLNWRQFWAKKFCLFFLLFI